MYLSTHTNICTSFMPIRNNKTNTCIRTGTYTEIYQSAKKHKTILRENCKYNKYETFFQLTLSHNLREIPTPASYLNF